MEKDNVITIDAPQPTTEAATSPRELPHLSDAEKISLLWLHRRALMMGAQKSALDIEFGKACDELNHSTQAVMLKHGVGSVAGLSFSLDSLEFSFKQ